LSQGSLVTVRSSTSIDDPFQQQDIIIECDTRNVNTNDRLQLVTWNLSQHNLSLGDAVGSLRVVTCGDDDGDDGPKTCFQPLSLTMNVVNTGRLPVVIEPSRLELFKIDINYEEDWSSAVHLEGLKGRTVLNVGASINRTVSDLVIDVCQVNTARHRLYGTASDGTACVPFSDVLFWDATTDLVTTPAVPTTIHYLPPAPPASAPASAPVLPPPPVPPSPPPQIDHGEVNGGDDDDDDESLLRVRWVQALIAVAAFVYLGLVAYCALRIFRRCQRQHQDELALLQQKRQQLALEKMKKKQQQQQHQQQQNQETAEEDHDVDHIEQPLPSDE
jgi:hypothetical protein